MLQCKESEGARRARLHPQLAVFVNQQVISVNKALATWVGFC